MSEIPESNVKLLIGGAENFYKLSQINMVIDRDHYYFLVSIIYGPESVASYHVPKSGYERDLYAFLPEFPYFKKKYEAKLAHRRNVAELADYIRANKH